MNIWIIGDLHQDYRPVENFYQNHLKDSIQENWLICLGDFGANYAFNHFDQHFKCKLSSYPIKYFVIRGNHEERASNCARRNPNAWEEVECFGNICLREKAFPNIYYALDGGGIYDIAGRKTLVIPGAYSVDKWYRLQTGRKWFQDEQLTQEEMDKLYELSQGQFFNLILSHTCAYSYQPTDLFLRGLDQSTVDNTMEIWMDKLCQLKHNMTWGVWCFAHYHQDRIEAPYVEMFFHEAERLEDVENRWIKYDETSKLDWWIPMSPSMERGIYD